MPNRVVIFPADQLAAAEAYKAWADAEYVAKSGDNSQFAYIRPDAFGQHVVPYLGEPFAWDGVPWIETAQGVTKRAAGVLHDTAVWPEEE